ncbi:MAG: M28 family peptidase [Xanthomonadaceae bacterium]|jgi:hypothetical protein|nr:M28 family peptidase [Xanthomonadaceae bacterium]
MRRIALFAAGALLFGQAAFAAETETRIPSAALNTASQLLTQALEDDTGLKVVESLTTEVGPRLAGSEADARAVAWAEAKFKELGFNRVWTEPVTFPKWVRRGESASVIGPHAQPLVIAALGGSPGGTLEAEVVQVNSMDELQKIPAESVHGKILFINYVMSRTPNGYDYRFSGAIRTRGASIAAGKGAVGFLMRSAATYASETSMSRTPHTGLTRFDEGQTPIPAAALALSDAEQLDRLVKLGTTRVRMSLDCGWDGRATSYNVIGEITGREKPDEVVLLGAHLDSWDLGTGAVDDGAGIGITMAAGHLLGKLPRAPKRTIRVVAFANEEQGVYGGRAYADRHGDEAAKHQLVIESDSGTGLIYSFNTSSPPYARAAVQQIADALLPLNIGYIANEGSPGTDIKPISSRGAAWAWLAQDGSDYFDIHHSALDTLDKIVPRKLAQNVAAYAVLAYLAAEADGGFGSASTPGTSGE